MFPVNFPQANVNAIAPENNPEVRPMPLYSNGEYCVSCWQLNDEDIALVNTTRRVWFSYMTPNKTHAPILLSVTPPTDIFPVIHAPLLKHQAAKDWLLTYLSAQEAEFASALDKILTDFGYWAADWGLAAHVLPILVDKTIDRPDAALIAQMIGIEPVLIAFEAAYLVGCAPSAAPLKAALLIRGLDDALGAHAADVAREVSDRVRYWQPQIEAHVTPAMWARLEFLIDEANLTPPRV